MIVCELWKSKVGKGVVVRLRPSVCPDGQASAWAQGRRLTTLSETEGLEDPAFGGTCDLLQDSEFSYGSPKGERSIFPSPGSFSAIAM